MSKFAKSFFTPLKLSQYVILSISFIVLVSVIAHLILPQLPVIRWTLLVLVGATFGTALKIVASQEGKTAADVIIEMERFIRRVFRMIISIPRSEKIMLVRLAVWYFLLVELLPILLKEYGDVYLTKSQVITTITILNYISILFITTMTIVAIYCIVHLIKRQMNLKEQSQKFRVLAEEINELKIALPVSHVNGKCIVNLDALLDKLMEVDKQDLYQRVKEDYNLLIGVEWNPYPEKATLIQEFFGELRKAIKSKEAIEAAK
ncbi:hypothetical protein ABHN11_24360 [Brevibacillus centrosporus]|uniref:hypothetical protein n=1 Tax=Brevibacillus centrosporus TaxID=54910 RepID=UPI003D1DAEC5